MEFIAMYNLWVSAQTKAAALPSATVTVNQLDQLIEFKAGSTVILASADLGEIHIALDAATIIAQLLGLI